MPLTPGTQIGPYEIVAPIGAGGMGEVYRAVDSRLGRDVALKILPESFARDADRLRRFEQETLAVAALNHPNILAIYDTGHHNGAPFLVCELLEGESLRTMLDRGPLPQRKVIDYGVQISQGLAAAHEKGIIHRDLKPENLFLTRDGRAKILDFGLAKLARPELDGATMTRGVTAAGVVMGTASYMAPEQVRGEAVDARTDIFALGAVLYEMLSGKRAFHRGTAAETMAAVLNDDVPDLPDAELSISPALDRIVRRCLEKSPEQRFHSAKDLSFALGVLSGTNASGASRIQHAVARPANRWLWAGLALVVLAVASTAIWFYASAGAPMANRMEFAIPVSGEASHTAISPDGRMLAFVSPDDNTGAPMLFVQRVGTLTSAELAGTEGASYPFWSPDDNYLAFFANGKLQKIAVTGGPPQMLAQASFARGGSWGRKNVIIYSPDPGSPIWKVSADGGDAAPVTDRVFEKTEDSHRWPVFLPDGDHFLFLAAKFDSNPDNPANAIYMTPLSSREKKLLLRTRSNPAYGAGYLFYEDENKSLSAVPLDISKETLSGNPRVIGGHVGYQPSVYWGAFTASENGTVVYNESTAAASSVLTWYARDGKELGRVGDVVVQANPSLSPDASRVAVDITDLKANNLDVWLEDVKRGTGTRFTFDPAEQTNGIWSRDGTTVAYRSATNGTAVELKKADGMQAERTLVQAVSGQNVAGAQAEDFMPNSWSLDGKLLLCTMQSILSGASGSKLLLIPVSGGDPVVFVPSQSGETNGQISADGKWAAYASNESGAWEIYVTTFPGGVGKWQVSRGGGSEPRWRGDGKEIFYLGPTGMLMAVPVNSGESFSSGTPAPLFQVRARAPISSTDLFTYDVTKDGQRFLVNQYVKPEHVAPLTIVQHALADPPK
jgi:Tol biopolymer transport system component